jgi:hypothetical protein
MRPVECKEQAAQCRRMAQGAPNLRVQAILTDMARTWDKAGDRNRDQPGERTIVASDPSTGLAGEPYTFLASNYAACESGSIAFGCLSRS